MKKVKILIISILFSFSTISAFCQDYYPLIQEHNTWNVLSVVGSIFDTSYSTITYKLTGDTIINAITYKKLYASEEEQAANWSLWGFMREDTDKKVWIRWHSDEEEFLAYDFSIDVGDSVLAGVDNPEYLRVDSISEIEINQSQRKKFWLSAINYPTYYNETWIEGIGSNKGICWSGSIFVVGGWFRLLCMHENETLIYSNPNYESCYLITDINEIENPIMEVFPNPATTQTWLQLPENTALSQIQIELYSPAGKLLHKTKPSSNFHKIDVAHLPKGLYLVRLWDGERWYVEKLVVH
ncbi:MAG: T9SS type A sorting domain-containing protein [Bacteroidetes bacterium]|nr:T9SS type A sorting domain-containing protein [Bacteroidota bacterium]